MKRDLAASKAIATQRFLSVSATTGIIALVMLMGACSTFRASSKGTWTATFFDNPDRVWNAVELALLELDYEVVSENRADGVIRAESRPGDDGTVIVLAVDQVMRTEDQVNVYVKPSFAGDRGSADAGLLKAAADAFVKNLEGKLKG